MGDGALADTEGLGKPHLRETFLLARLAKANAKGFSVTAGLELLELLYYLLLSYPSSSWPEGFFTVALFARPEKYGGRTQDFSRRTQAYLLASPCQVQPCRRLRRSGVGHAFLGEALFRGAVKLLR